MRIPSIIWLFLAFILLIDSAFASQAIDIGVAKRKGEGVLPISIQSQDSAVLKIARRAFGLHGGYTQTEPGKSAFIFKFERTSSASVIVSILNGQPVTERFRREVFGLDLANAVLRASDIAVEATLETKGFFAGKLAYVRKQGEVAEIYTSDMLFDKVRPLTADRAHVTGPDWSPDGRALLFTTFKNGFPDVYKIDLDTRRIVPIATFPGTNTAATFSPDGKRIALSVSGTGNSEIAICAADGSNFRQVTRSKSLETSPSWSPEGGRLVVESDIRGKPQLYQLPASGGSLSALPTNVSRYCSEPEWNPVNKNLIAFTAAIEGGFQIIVYDMKSRKSEVLTSVRDSAVEPEWLSDGRHLIFTKRQRGRTRLMILDTKTRKISELHAPGLGDVSSATFVHKL